MAISVKCQNGHVLKVRDEFAGKAGLCPHCNSPVYVPMPVNTAENARISDDEILGLLGRPRKAKPEPLPQAAPVLDSAHDQPKQESAVGLAGSKVVPKRKVCPECARVTSITSTRCSRCGTPLPDV